MTEVNGLESDDAANLASLARAPWRLQGLRLTGPHVGGAEGAALLAATDWPTLHTLDLEDSGLGPAGAVKLAAARWPRLCTLNLNGNEIGDAGAGATTTRP